MGESCNNKNKASLEEQGGLQVFRQRSDIVRSKFWKSVSREEKEPVEGENRSRGIQVILF